MESNASVKTKCDGCNATLSSTSSYPDKRGTMSLHLNDGQDDNGYDKHNRYDYCGESCMLAHLQKRAKNKNTAQGASMTFSKASVTLDASKTVLGEKFLSSLKK